MIRHTDISPQNLRSQIRKQKICLGGNMKLKIYGKLSCTSGKKMKPENRIFFASEAEAIEANFRPCGHCMKEKYRNWKKKFKKA